jgi:hypothetical protein
VMSKARSRCQAKFYLRFMSSTDFVGLFPLQNQKYVNLTRSRVVGGSKTATLHGSDHIGLASEAALH